MESTAVQFVLALQVVVTVACVAAVWARGGFSLGPNWTPKHTRDGWMMRRKIDGKIETRPTTEAEAADARADADYEWWATR